MKSISVRVLHAATGKWVRRAHALGELHITDRGQIVAKLVGVAALPARPFFAYRKFLPAYRKARPFLNGGMDLSNAISEGRDQMVP
jgi:antitoxin (DNA-binding transcriptional repressor) of toxin-antitoxin stability system